MRLSAKQNSIHERAVGLSQKYHKLEWDLIQCLQEVEKNIVHRALAYSSLFQYAVKALGLVEPVANMMITVARKAIAVPVLREALQSGRISGARAARIASALTIENSKELVNFALTHTFREIDFEIAKRNPKSGAGERAKPISDEQVEVRVIISKAAYENFKRSQSLVAHRKGIPNNISLSGTLEIVLQEHTDRHDPVQKAKRAMARKQCAHIVKDGVKANRVSGKRIPLTAEQKHSVFARDGGRCTFEDASGLRCTNDRWLHAHHIKQVRRGGTNDPRNITSLCSAHHDLVHQMSLPIEGQVSWLRAPSQWKSRRNIQI